MKLKVEIKGVARFEGHGSYPISEVGMETGNFHENDVVVGKLLLVKQEVEACIEEFVNTNEINSPIISELTNLANILASGKYSYIDIHSKYMNEFDAEDYDVPKFLLSGDWVDVSWHNNACPSFENKKHKITVWVAERSPMLRETFSDVYTVIDSANKDSNKHKFLYSTNDVNKLQNYLTKLFNRRHSPLANNWCIQNTGGGCMVASLDLPTEKPHSVHVSDELVALVCTDTEPYWSIADPNEQEVYLSEPYYDRYSHITVARLFNKILPIDKCLELEEDIKRLWAAYL